MPRTTRPATRGCGASLTCGASARPPPGSWVQVQARRAATLRAAYQAHPERFRGRCPQPKNLPAKVWINEPPATIETTNHASSLMSHSV
jgi:hypothetical protein